MKAAILYDRLNKLGIFSSNANIWSVSSLWSFDVSDTLGVEISQHF